MCGASPLQPYVSSGYGDAARTKSVDTARRRSVRQFATLRNGARVAEHSLDKLADQVIDGGAHHDLHPDRRSIGHLAHLPPGQ
jgi:hypothetical protein